MTPEPTPTPQDLWNDFRRASIAAVITVLVAFFLYMAGAEPAANVLLIGSGIGWAIYVVAFTLPGVVRHRIAVRRR